MRKAILVLMAILALLPLLPVAVLAQDPPPQTYTFPDDSLTFNYPAGWSLTEDNNLAMLSNRIPSSPNGEPEPGEVQALIITPFAVQHPELWNAPAGSDMTTVAQAGIASMNLEEGVETSEPETVDLGGRDGVMIRVTDPPLSLFVLSIDLGDGQAAAMTAIGFTDELELFEPTLLFIASSVAIPGDDGPDGPADVGPPVVITASPTAVSDDAPEETEAAATATATAIPSTPPPTVEPSPTATLPPVEQDTFQDGFFTFSYPASWGVVPQAYGLQMTDDVGLEAQVIYPGSPGMQVGQYAGRSPEEVIEVFRVLLTGRYTLSATTNTTRNGRAMAYATTAGLDSEGGPIDIILIVVDLGGNHVGMIYAEMSAGQLSVYQERLLEVTSGMVYNGPPTAALPPEDVAPPPAAPPSDPGDGSGDDPAPPAAPTLTSAVQLYYANGTLTIYNGSEDILNAANIEFVATTSGERFGPNDLGYGTLSFFQPDRCITIYLTTQPYAPPAFCSGVRQLAYLSGDTPNRFWVWDPAFSSEATFLVQRDGETLATCNLAAGQCEFDVPVRVIPFEQ